MRKPAPASFIEKGTRTGWGRGGFNVTGHYIPPQPHIGPYWKSVAKKLALRVVGASIGSAAAAALTGYELYKLYKSMTTQQYSIFPKRTRQQANMDEVMSTVINDPTARYATIGNARQYLTTKSKSRGKRPAKLKDIVNKLKTFKIGRWSSYNSHDYQEPASSNPYSATNSRTGLTLPLNSIENTATSEQVMPVYCFNISCLIRNHRRYAVGANDPLNTYPAIYAIPAYRLTKVASMTTGVFPKYEWQPIPGIHNGYTTNTYPLDAANIPTSYVYNVTDTDVTNKPNHHFAVDWAKIKTYFYGCTRPRTINTAFGFFSESCAAPRRYTYKRMDDGSWQNFSFDTNLNYDDDLQQDVALYYEQWMASILGHPFDKPVNRIKDTSEKTFIKFFKKETISLGVDTTINRDTNALQVFKSHFRKDGQIRSTYDTANLFNRTQLKDESDFIGYTNVTHPRNDDVAWDVTTDATNFQVDQTKDIWYFVWVKDQGIIYNQDTFAGENWNIDKHFLSYIPNDVTFDIDIQLKNTIFPDLAH